jgi:hypothetical protein
MHGLSQGLSRKGTVNATRKTPPPLWKITKRDLHRRSDNSGANQPHHPKANVIFAMTAKSQPPKHDEKT